MLNNAKAYLFDLDGTLLDTFNFIYGAFEYAFWENGVEPLSRESISHLMGGPLVEVYRAMAPGHNAELLAESHRKFQSDNLNLVKLFPDTLKVLEALKRNGRKIAAITTRSNVTSVRSLKITRIEKYFDIIISAEDVQKHKPHPEPIFRALEFLGSQAQESVMVGDTAADTMAGKNAGAKTVAALYGFGGEGLLELNPDYSIYKLSELLLL